MRFFDKIVDTFLNPVDTFTLIIDNFYSMRKDLLEPRLIIHEKKSGKLSYVTWYERVNDKFVRKKRYQSKNIVRRDEAILELRSFFNQLKERILKLHNPEVRANLIPVYLEDAFLKLIELQNPTLRAKTMQNYKSYLHKFLEWGKEKNIYKIEDVQKNVALAFHDYLVLSGFSSKTVSSIITGLKSNWEKMVEREWTKENPWRKIKVAKVVSESHAAYTTEHAQIVWEWLKVNNLRLFYFTKFIYYTFCRPLELVGLQVKDINFKEKTMTVPAKVSKNKKTLSVQIPAALMEIINEMKLSDYSQTDYIFGHNLITCSKVCIRNRVSEAHRKALEAVELKTLNYTLYSWKHTGAIALYNKTKDIKKIMAQMRHASISETDNYLRDLGIIQDSSLKDLDW